MVLMDRSIKHYPGKQDVPLPQPAREVGCDLFQAIMARESVRQFRREAISGEQFGQLLFSGAGIREVRPLDGYRDYRRNAPSAGNLGSVDIYPVVLRVETHAPGVYHYSPAEHRLNLLSDQDPAAGLAHWLLQPSFRDAAAILVLGSSLGRVRAKYGIRGYRYACFDAGHAAQNLCLTAEGLGLVACPLGSFDDDRVNEMLGLDGMEEAALYAVAVGVSEPTTTS